MVREYISSLSGQTANNVLSLENVFDLPTRWHYLTLCLEAAFEFILWEYISALFCETTYNFYT